MGYTVVDVADLEDEGPGGMVRKVRRELGARVRLLGRYEPPGWG